MWKVSRLSVVEGLLLRRVTVEPISPSLVPQSSLFKQVMKRSELHIRGTPLRIRASAVRLGLVLVSVFLALPGLLAPVLRLDEALPLSLRLVLVLAGATSWAASSFLTSAAWFSIAVSAAVAQGLFLASKRDLVDPALVLPASAPLLAAGILGAQGWKTLDMLLVLAGAGAGLAQGQLKVALPSEIQAAAALVLVVLLTSPGVIGHEASRHFSPLQTLYFLVPSLLSSAVLAVQQGSGSSVPMVVLAFLSSTLLLAAHLSKQQPEPSAAAQDNSRASHWLFAGLAASLCAVHMQRASAPHGLAVLTLILSGAGASVSVSSFLGWTARVWGPVRSGEFQMVTLDFVALLAYFITPLLYVLYLAWSQFAPALPALPLQVPELVLECKGLVQAGVLAVTLVAAAEAFLGSRSSVLWAHWLIPTYTLGKLDTKKVALVTRLSAMLEHCPKEELVKALTSAGIKPLNIFASATDAASHSLLIKDLQLAGHVVGLETGAGPFTSPGTAAREVSDGVRVLTERALVPSPAWYLGTDGFRNPFALVRASSFGMHLVAPAMRVTLGDNAGMEIVRLLDPWCKGGVVLVEPSTRGRIHVKATLEDLKQHMQGAKYAPCALGDVCEEVQEMRLEQ